MYIIHVHNANTYLPSHCKVKLINTISALSMSSACAENAVSALENVRMDASWVAALGRIGAEGWYHDPSAYALMTHNLEWLSSNQVLPEPFVLRIGDCFAATQACSKSSVLDRKSDVGVFVKMLPVRCDVCALITDLTDSVVKRSTLWMHVIARRQWLAMHNKAC